LFIVGQDFDFNKTCDFNLKRVVITYMGNPVFLAFFIYHKLRYKTKMIPLDKVNLSQDVDMKSTENK
ncbi:gamma-aminobutyrate permease, partial [Staphylococcus arlettae]